MDESMAAPSISEDVLTVGAGAPGEEEEEEETETETENEDEVCAMHVLMIIKYNCNIRLIPPPLPPAVPQMVP